MRLNALLILGLPLLAVATPGLQLRASADDPTTDVDNGGLGVAIGACANDCVRNARSEIICPTTRAVGDDDSEDSSEDAGGKATTSTDTDPNGADIIDANVNHEVVDDQGDDVHVVPGSKKDKCYCQSQLFADAVVKCITDKCPKSLAITESTIKSSCAQGGVPFTLSFSKDPDTESPTVPGPPANPPGKPTTGAKGTNNTLSSPDKSAAFQVALPNVFAAVCVGAAVVLYDFRI